MRKVFSFGKIRFEGQRKRVNSVEVTLELRKWGGDATFRIDLKTGERVTTGRTPEYTELSICGDIWNARHTDIICCGQCLDTIAEYRDQLSNKETFDELYDLWKHYHLNGLHAGTTEQEAVVDEWKKAGNAYDYVAVCEMLKERGLYEMDYTGLSIGRRYENEPYRYGQAWLVRELPEEIIEQVKKLCAKCV